MPESQSFSFLTRIDSPRHEDSPSDGDEIGDFHCKTCKIISESKSLNDKKTQRLDSKSLSLTNTATRRAHKKSIAQTTLLFKNTNPPRVNYRRTQELLSTYREASAPERETAKLEGHEQAKEKVETLENVGAGVTHLFQGSDEESEEQLDVEDDTNKRQVSGQIRARVCQEKLPKLSLKAVPKVLKAIGTIMVYYLMVFASWLHEEIRHLPSFMCSCVKNFLADYIYFGKRCTCPNARGEMWI